MSEKPEEVDIDDDALEVAAGGIALPNSPKDAGGGTTNYITNSTIYYSHQ